MSNARHVFSCSFAYEEPLLRVNEIARIHNCSRTDVLETLLQMYNAESFSAELPKFLNKKKEQKKALLAESRKKRNETKELATLLNNNPELLERLKRELAND